MSLIKQENLTCPKCGKSFDFTIHSSVNVGLDPQDKAKILDLSLFKYQCPHCRYSDYVCYPILYHDPANELMIQVLWNEADFGQPLEKDLQDLIEIMGEKDYRRREVFGYRELIEKIIIFDSGLDDFAMALLKTIHRSMNPDVQLYFYEQAGNELRFIQMKDEEILSDAAIMDIKLYQMALEYSQGWKKQHQFYESLRVDENYFAEEVARLIQQSQQQ